MRLKRHWHSRLRPTDSEVLEACELYRSGWTLKELGKKFNHSKSTMHRWINNYAIEAVNTDMKKNNGFKGTYEHPVAKKAKRVVGQHAPETIAVPINHQDGLTQSGTPNESETPEQKIARLERELRDAKLMRDFYNEMINVAEQQFNIPIRKKAGTRR